MTIVRTTRQFLSQLARELRSRDIRVFLAKLGTDHLELLRRAGTLDELDADSLQLTVRAAVAYAQTNQEGTSYARYSVVKKPTVMVWFPLASRARTSSS